MQSRLSLDLKTPRETKQNSRDSLYGSVMFDEIFLNLRQSQTDYKMEACFCGIQIEARSKFHVNFTAAKLPLVIECCNASNHPPRHHLYQILDPEPNVSHVCCRFQWPITSRSLDFYGVPRDLGPPYPRLSKHYHNICRSMYVLDAL